METIYDIYDQIGGEAPALAAAANKVKSANAAIGAMKSSPAPAPGPGKLAAAANKVKLANAAIGAMKSSGVGLKQEKIMASLKEKIGQCKTLSNNYQDFLKSNKEMQIELDSLVKTLQKALLSLEGIGKDYDEVTKKIAGIKSGNANRLKELEEQSAKNKADLEEKLRQAEEKTKNAIEHEKAELAKKDQEQKAAAEQLKKQQEEEARIAKEQADKEKQDALAAAKQAADAAATKAAEEASKAANLAGEQKAALESQIKKLGEEHKLALEKKDVLHSKAMAMAEMTNKKHEKEMEEQHKKQKEELNKMMEDKLEELGKKDAAEKAAELKAAQAKCDAQQQSLFGEINTVLGELGNLSVQADEDAKIKLDALQEIINKSTTSINALAEKIKKSNSDTPNPAAAASGKAKLGSAMGKLSMMSKGAKAASAGVAAKQTKMEAVGIMNSATSLEECDKILDEYRIQKRQCKTNVNLKNKTKAPAAPAAATPAPAATTPAPAAAATGGECANLQGSKKERCERRRARAAKKAARKKLIEDTKKEQAGFNPKKGGYRYGKKSRRRKRTLKTKMKTQRMNTKKRGKRRKGKRSRKRRRSKSSKKRR